MKDEITEIEMTWLCMESAHPHIYYIHLVGLLKRSNTFGIYHMSHSEKDFSFYALLSRGLLHNGTLCNMYILRECKARRINT